MRCPMSKGSHGASANLIGMERAILAVEEMILDHVKGRERELEEIAADIYDSLPVSEGLTCADVAFIMALIVSNAMGDDPTGESAPAFSAGVGSLIARFFLERESLAAVHQ